MREEHRRGMRDEGWGPSPRPGGPEWGPRSGRGPGRFGGERGERGEHEYRGERRGPGGPGRPGGPGGRGWGREGMEMPPFGPPGPPFGPGDHPFGRHGFGRGMRARKGDVHLVRNAGDTVAVSMHVYGTDIARVGSSVRRVYDLPVR